MMPLMDPASIISEVKKNPILYDYTLVDYKNVQKKNSVWDAIAKEVGAANGETVSWKWKNLRDSYAKYRKHIHMPINEHGPKSKLLNWRWAPMMTFLNPFLRRPREFIGPSPYTDDNDDAEESTEFEAKTNEESQDSNNTSSCAVSSIKTECTNENVTNTGNKYKRKAVEMIDEVYIDYPQEGSSNRLDMTDYLFLNYAETFKKLSRKRQALLKLEMAKMFAAAELEELQSDPIRLKVLNEDSD